MKTFTVAVILAVLAAPASAFLAPQKAFRPVSGQSSRNAVRKLTMEASVFDSAVSEFKSNFPGFYSRGWGPTTKAERWNGRHAMFGWVALIATGYAQSHNLIPNFDTPLDLSEWGTLALISGKQSITNGRAIILIAHVHALVVSVCSALAPLSFQDKLLLDEGESDEPAAGLFPTVETGLTKSAELWNGRVAMLGLVVLVLCSVATDTPILNVIDAGLGGLLLKA